MVFCLEWLDEMHWLLKGAAYHYGHAHKSFNLNHIVGWLLLIVTQLKISRIPTKLRKSKTAFLKLCKFKLFKLFTLMTLKIINLKIFWR